MNTEINFLERQPKKYIVPLVIGVVFSLFMIGILSVLFIQKNYYTDKIESENTKLVQIENALQEYHSQYADEQHLQKMAQSVSTIQSNATPNVALYHHLLALLPNENRLIYYQKQKENQVVMEAEFKGLQDAADYVSTLLQQTFIVGTELTNVGKSDSGYRATLTILFNKDKLVEELGSDD